MATIPAEKARTRFSEIINRAAYANERTIVTRHGKSVAAVISMPELEILERLMEVLENRADARAARAGIREADEEGTMSLDELKADLGL